MIKVSVTLITYNHVQYIAQALESVLMQQTDWDFELLIGDDFSTDGTREIVLDFQRRYPQRIRLILPSENLGSQGKLILPLLLKAARGQYIALLDGDDYWTSPHKLQKQADFLDAHPECAVCFHNVWVTYENGTRRSWLRNPPGQKRFSDLRDILSSNFIASCSTMYRHGLFGELPAWFNQVINPDRMLHILNAEHGQFGYIDEDMAVYRVHDRGVWSSRTPIDRLRGTIASFRVLNENTGYRHDTAVRGVISLCFYALAFEHTKFGQLRPALSALRQAVCARPYNPLFFHKARMLGERFLRRR
jgi:glycosyltransferase involved in cell wall biosynthesis